jgi:MurNAc alpha-1-phosphate uridylyltransferase
MVAHLGAHPAAARLHLSHEQPVALGTAGALGALQEWLADRPVLVVNADTYSHETPEHDSVAALLAAWDGTTTRLLCRDRGQASDFGTWQYVGAALMPPSEVRGLPATPAGLYELRWAAAYAAGTVELVETPARVVDCGTPADYLAANLLTSGGESVIGEGAHMRGSATECVIWPGATVEAGEQLHRVIRAVDDRGRPVTVAAEHRPKLTGRRS